MHQYKVLVGKPEGKGHLGDPHIEGRAVLRAGLEAMAQERNQ
jgi:hypothetical protein